MITSALSSLTARRLSAIARFMRTMAACVPCGAALVGALGRDLHAQAASAGHTKTAIQVSASLVVGYRMHVRQIAPARIVERNAGMIEVELSLEAASNVAWRLTMAAPLAQDSVAFSRTEVRDASGAWRTLDRANSVTVVGERPPCNPTPITVRVRLYDDAQIAALSAPRFMMDTAARGL
ncbi:MAG TPA: hypothetical protein VJR92_08300 [Gemmatimonadaceae bacterium]|nr:hypothetical protein [Gemmatimonadaceae bacterium]